MISNSFVGSARPSLGVELELQLVDPRSMALTGAIEPILEGLPGEFRDAIKPEFYDCCVEVSTGVCGDVAEVERDLVRKLATTARIAASHGVLVGWGGTHPFSHWRDQPVVATPRYRELVGLYRETLRQQLTFGLHIHVGVGDGDTAIRVCNRIAEHLPALLALSANSPFWCGRATGLHSHRVEVMGSSPTAGFPPRLGGWADFVRMADRMMASGLIQTPKELWWDVRPSASFGTVEVRMCDMPPDLSSVLGLTALTQCLVVELARVRDDEPGLDECGMVMVRQNRWRAARFGLDAELVDPRTGRPSPAREVVGDLVMRLRGTAEQLGCDRGLGLVRAMAAGPSGAARQLAVFERTGDLAAVARYMTGGYTSAPDHDTTAIHDGAGLIADSPSPSVAAVVGA